MKFIEETLIFEDPVKFKDTRLAKVYGTKAVATLERMSGPVSVAGILVRLGNEPIVRNLKKILELSNANIPPEIAVLFDKKDIYSIVHAIGAIRVEGQADVEELQYHARVTDVPNVQTIDLLPATKFKEVIKAGVTIEGALSSAGSVSAKIPDDLANTLLPKYVNLGGDMQIQLSSNASFVGKFTFAIKLPTVQSMGIASNQISWILNPDEEKTPLLGDQLLVQFVAVPKGATQLTYEIFGRVQVDRGLFHFSEVKETGKHSILVPL